MRHQQVLGVAAIMFGKAHPLRLFAQLFVPGHAQATQATAPAAVHRHGIAFLHRLYARTQRDDPPGILVTQREWEAG